MRAGASRGGKKAGLGMGKTVILPIAGEEKKKGGRDGKRGQCQENRRLRPRREPLSAEKKIYRPKRLANGGGGGGGEKPWRPGLSNLRLLGKRCRREKREGKDPNASDRQERGLEEQKRNSGRDGERKRLL